MKSIMLLPLFLGIAGVLQGGLNRQMALKWGLASAVFVNAVVFFIACLALFLAAKAGASWIASDFSIRGNLSQFKWWYLLPGLFGFAFVVGIPYAIPRIGALQVFLGIIAFQLIGSMLWDLWVEGIAISWHRVAGSALALVGAGIASYR